VGTRDTSAVAMSDSDPDIERDPYFSIDWWSLIIDHWILCEAASKPFLESGASRTINQS